MFEADAARDRTSGIQEKYQQLDLPGHFQVPPSDSDVENVPRPPEGKREETGAILSRVSSYPRLRYMGSKYRVVPHLVHIFSRLRFETALDPFCGSGVVAYALKVMGKQVTASDYLSYAATVAHATVENPGVRMSSEDIDLILSPSADGRDFIQRTFEGLYFPPDDLAFLDAAWSHIEGLPPYKRSIALSALCLAAARKQPRGVFTVVDLRYDDGRRYLRMPLRDLFVESAHAYDAVAFDNGRKNSVACQDVLEVNPDGFDLVYLDPPYAPPRDDNDYIKRYHFLEGLSVYWRGQRILGHTLTKKIAKRYTPFAYKHTIRGALAETFRRFRRSTIVLSYSSNSIPGEREIYELLRREKNEVETHTVAHRYSFGTHSAALRRRAYEYIFVAR